MTLATPIRRPAMWRKGLFRRSVALVLSWVFTATTVWSAAPPVLTAAAAAVAPALARPGLRLTAEPPARLAGGPRAEPMEADSFEGLAPEPEPETEPGPSEDPPGEGGQLGVGVFGPQRYVRTTGPKNVYTTTVDVPAWVVSPFTLHIQNGEPDGTYRVSSAWITVNGTDVAAAPADLNQNVASLERPVSLTPQTTLVVTLASQPTSYLSIGLFGTNADHTSPQVAVSAPAAGTLTNDRVPRLLVTYRDTPGSGEPAASGVATSTLKVTLDGVDRTGLFTVRSDEASARVPDDLALAEGFHVLRATIADEAGNVGEAVSQFRIDLTPPQIRVDAPPSGVYLPTQSPTLRVSYSDDVELALPSLRIAVNGADRTAEFTPGPAQAEAILALPEGGNEVLVQVQDRAGNAATASARFNVDVQPPRLTVGQPAGGSRHGSSDVPVLVQYGDDQGLDLATFLATVDGQPAALVPGPDSATGIVTALADGPHRLETQIKDRAGNLATAGVDFTVDSTVPAMRVVQPAPGSLIPDATPDVLVEYSDAQGVDTATLQVLIGGADRTAWCERGAGSATCTIPPEGRLGEGASTIAAEVRDLTGNLGRAESTFTVDTIQPTGSLEAPSGPTNTARPAIRVAYGDGTGTGVDVRTVRILVDGTDRTSSFAVAEQGATAVLEDPLADGGHTVRVTLSDRAGNQATLEGSFTIDTAAPTGSFGSPADDSFINDATPALRLSYADGAGTGVVTASVRLWLQSGTDGTWRDITSYVQAGAAEAVGVVPADASLPDGTHHLRAEFADQAGNVGVTQASFELDTVAPTYRIETPADGGYVATRTPAFSITFADDRSQVDKAQLALLVDGVDLTSRLVIAGDRMTGTLPAEDALGEGLHQVAVTVVDRAGNVAAATPHAFTVDTVPPQAVLETPPDGDYLPASPALVRFTYSDPNGSAPDGSIDPASVHVLVDGNDRTAEFAPTAERAEAALSPALADGAHTVRVEVLDWAGNPASAQGTFAVDTLPPRVEISAPPAGSYHRQSPISVSGIAEDADPQLSVQCQGAGTPSAAVLSGGGFSCQVPLAEGANTVQVVAQDRFGRTGTASRGVVLDTQPPQAAITQPRDGDFTSALAVDVRGTVVDASEVTVAVDGAAASVTDGTFTASGVPLGAGPAQTLRAVAEDLAGNISEATVMVRIDRTPPVVSISTPTAGAYLRGPTVQVGGSAEDPALTSVDVNGVEAALSGPGSGSATFNAQVPAAEGAFTITATARDAAGNAGTAQTSVVVDSVPPAITIHQPAAGTVTRETSVLLAGMVADASPVMLSLGGVPVPVGPGGTFSTSVDLPSEGPQSLALTATDAAGNTGSASVNIVADRTPPTLQIAGPAEGAAIGSLPAVVQGIVNDATPVTVTVDGVVASRVQDAWQASLANLPEGPHELIVTATDAGGNETTLSRHVTVDLSPPVVTIMSPPAGSLTREAATTVTGTVQDRSPVTVTVGGVTAVVSGGGPFTFTAVVALNEGDNRLVAVATDGTGRSGEAEVGVTRDSTPPVVELVAPERVSRGRPGQATASVADNLAVAQVTFNINRDTCAGGSGVLAAPYVIPVTVPPCATAGDTLTLTVQAFDTAGNSAQASRGVRVVADGVVVGQVLSDATSLPLPGADVRVVGVDGVSVMTDERGSYSLPARDTELALVAEASGMTSVERRVAVAEGTGTVPVDARLTPLASPVTVTPQGGTLTAPGITVAVPAGAVPTATAFRLTALSAQGLPALLPLGWSPVAALDLRADGPVFSALAATLSGLPSPAVHLVEYRPSVHEWVMVAPALTATDGSLEVSLPAPGSFAVIAADAPDLAVPAVGEVLTGLPFQPLPPTITGSGVVEPATLPPSGGTALGRLAVQSTAYAASGSVVQAEVTETFTLASGDVASEETRRQDIVLYSTPRPEGAALAATFPITPSRTFATTELVEGRVHLDVLAGREGVRGTTGGSEPVTLDAGDARLSVAAHALAEDTALSVEVPLALSSFLPAAANLVPLAEIVIDFSGQALALPAELSFLYSAVSPDDTLLVASVERLDGIPRLAVVALAQLAGDRIVSKPYAGLPGITKGGRYVFYRSAPVGFVSGTTSSSAGAVKAVVTTAGLPFVGLSGADGRFIVPAVPGPATAIAATVPHTSLQGAGTVSVAAGATTAFDLTLTGAVATATVVPADGTVAVPVSIQIELTTTAPLNAATAIPANVSLTRAADAQVVPVRLVLSGSGRSLSIIPEAALAFSTHYRLVVQGLADVFGGLVSVPPVLFTTKDDVAPVLDYGKLKLSFPDENGIVQVTAPDGTFPPGTTILIINSGNGVVLGLTAGNQGQVSGELPATFDHRILVTIIDPLGNSKSFERSQFVAPDGRAAVGAGGGVIEAADGSGVEMRIPEGALDRGVTFKITSFGADLFEERPELPEANFGSGLKIEASDKTTFKKEVDLAFPLPSGLPENPKDAFFYVYKRIQGPDGKVFFESLDNAFVEGAGADAKVVSASPPFSGYANGWNSWNPAAGAGFGSFGLGGGIIGAGTSIAIVMWTYNALLPGSSVAGVITGKVLRPVFKKGAPTPEYVGVAGVQVSRKDARDQGQEVNVAYSQGDGRFTFYDPHFTTGTVEIVAEPPGGGQYTATAYAVAKNDSKIQTDPALFSLVTGGYFNNIATANVVLPSEQAPPPPPRIAVRVMKVVVNGREDTSGIVIAGTQLVIGFKAANPEDGEVTRASVNGTDYTVRSPDPFRSEEPKSPFAMDAILQDLYEPTQPGTYTVTATALPAYGPPVYSSASFRVVAPGGSNLTSVEGAPAVLTAQVVPKDGATGVPVTVFPQVAFSEPVKNVTASTVQLKDADGGAVTARFIALAVGADGQPEPIDNFSDPGRAITSLTLQPLVGLRYDTTYTLSLTSDIVDLDTDPVSGQPTPQNLIAYATSFTTFGPEEVGESTDKPRGVGMVVFGDRGYFMETQYLGGVGGAYQGGQILAYDLSDPGSPRNLSEPPNPEVPAVSIIYPPRDIGGEELLDAEGNPTGEKSLAVVAAPRTYFFLQGEIVYYNELRSSPSNLFVYDATEGGRPRWVGAANLSNDILDGIPNRVVVKDGTAYIAMFNKGIAVVELERAKQGFPPDPTGMELIDINKKLFNGGLNQDAVIAIPVTDPPNPAPGTYPLKLPLNDLKVGDFVIDNVSRRLVLATGQRRQAALVIADPVSTEKLYQGVVASAAGSIESGMAIALTKADDGRDIAIVGGGGLLAGVGSGWLIALVDISDPRSPAVLSFLKLDGLASVGDLLVTGNTLIVSGGQGTVDPATGKPGLAILVDISDLSGPKVIGTIAGVGSRMALGPNGLLLSTERSFIKGNPSELAGIRTATLGEMAIITKVDPENILVSAGNEVFRDVDIGYKLIPPIPQTGEVRIDVKDGARVATLPATIDETGTGTTRWPQGTIVNLLQTYEARLHALKDGNEVRSFPRRLRFDKVPLAITTRDRLLRIQFALPEQGLFEENKYSVKVYVAAQGQDFSGNPAFTVSSQQIKDAYPNVETWFDDLDPATGKTEASWVARKIDKIELPPGLSSAIRRQAFEIGVVFGTYPQVKVEVVSDETGAKLAEKFGSVTADGVWSEIIAKTTDQVRAARGDFVPLEPIVPAPNVFEPDKVFSPFGGLAYRALFWALQSAMDSQLVKGLVDGFWAGWEGDKQTVVAIKDAALSPRETAKAAAGFLKDFVVGVLSPSTYVSIFSALVGAAQGFTWPTIGQAAYGTGYVIGFVFEQVVAGVALAFVTLGIGAIVAKAATLLKGAGWLTSMTIKARNLAKGLGAMSQGLLRRLGDSRKVRELLEALKELGPALDNFWAKYPQGETILDRAGQVAATSKAAAQRGVYWLSIVDRMSEAAAGRFLRLFERIGQEAGDRWLTRWAGLTNGKRATKEGFEAFERAGDAAEGVTDVLILGGDLDPAVPLNYTTKYGNRVESSLGPLRRNYEDVRYSDEGLAHTAEFHSSPEDIVPKMADDAVEGTAGVASVPCAKVAALYSVPVVIGGCGKIIQDILKTQYADLKPRWERLYQNLKAADDVAANEAFTRMFWAAHNADPEVARALVRATSFDGITPQAVAEYLKAVDAMRDAERRVITGLLDQAGDGATINIKRVGNRGSGSIPEGFEPVAAERLVKRGTIQRSQIESFGRKHRVSDIPGVTTSTIEGDCNLIDGTFIDMKHSLTQDAFISVEQINNLELILQHADRPIERAWFVTNGPVSDTIRNRIAEVNEVLKGARNTTEDLIKIIDDVGDYR